MNDKIQENGSTKTSLKSRSASKKPLKFKSPVYSEDYAGQNGSKSPSRATKNTLVKEYSSEVGAKTNRIQAPRNLGSPKHQITQQTFSDQVIELKDLTDETPETQLDIYEKSQISPNFHYTDTQPPKEKKKGVSFLSRFTIKSGKKKDQSEYPEDSEVDYPCTEGVNAHVFSSTVGANGFIPQHKNPPSYIKVLTRFKKNREFNHMFLAQELSCSKEIINENLDDPLSDKNDAGDLPKSEKARNPTGAIWAMEFSVDGRYLAAAGRDKIIRVWAVLSTSEERRNHESEEDMISGASGGERLSAPVLRSKPIQEYSGHTGEILDINWSKNNFLLSSSTDKAVKLWHPSRQECLCTFEHNDIVTSTAFHPTDDRFFLAGSLDSILRLWSIPERKVAHSCEFPDLITAVSFTPDGMTAIAGGMGGLCQFYDIDPDDGLKLSNQLYVRSSRGKNAKGSKITGIRPSFFPPEHPDAGELNILVTSNDSRIRLYHFKDKRLEMKFRGHQSTCSQINASFSDDGRYVICGRKISTTDSETKEKPPVEIFNAHSNIVTTAIMAPKATRRLLSASGDPIYDICNPPPVTLLSRKEHSISVSEDLDIRLVDHLNSKQIEESPVYLARTSHTDGPIIITSDDRGSVKCFRIDCAFERRHQWDTNSTFSKRRSSSRRANSITTKTPNSSRHNSQSSLNLSISTSVYNEHILSWRSNVKDDCSSFDSEKSSSPRKSTHINSQTSSISQIEGNIKYLSTSNTESMALNTDVSVPVPIIRACTLPPSPGFSFKNEPIKEQDLTTPLSKPGSFWSISHWRSSFDNGNMSHNNQGKFRPRDGLVRELSGVEEEVQGDYTEAFRGKSASCHIKEES
ncbi:BgTH12-05513 [Blumeria graminis f. sp. triticale]|uniref:BgTH12-05513 n=1 Tax=Blumeria graminis f. sp. triticale TaxID=1689686 RepID=A0A9W4GGE3_BLUGR|nr:BgTH12-05513 [Blumeria graminis f. sp. triticale]